MTTFAAYVEALNALTAVPERQAVEIAAIETEHRAALKAADAAEARARQQAEGIVALVEARLADARKTLAPVELENAVPRKVRPGSPPRDAAKIARGAPTALAEAHSQLDAAVTAVLANRAAEQDRRRQEFVDEEERRAQAERDRLAAEIRRKEEAERKAQADAQRRQLITRAILVGGGLLLIIVLAILLS